MLFFILNFLPATSQDAKYYLKKAKKEYKSDNYIEAINDLNKCNKLNPDQIETVFLLAQYHEAYLKNDSAIKYYEQAKLLCNWRKDIVIYRSILDHLGSIYLSQGKCEKAKENYEKINYNTEYSMYYKLAKCFFHEKQYSQALVYCGYIESQNQYYNNDNSTLILLAICNDSLASQNIDSAKIYYRQAFNYYEKYLNYYYYGFSGINSYIFKFSPDDEKYFIRLAKISEIIFNRPINEERYLNCALLANPRNADNLYNRSLKKNILNRNVEALTDINSALNINSDKNIFYRQRGLIYIALDSLDKAYSDLTTSLSKNKNDSLSYYLRGLVFYKKQNFSKALADFKRSQKLMSCSDPLVDSMIQKTNTEIFNSEIENMPPHIKIKNSTDGDPLTITFSPNLKSLPIKGFITDDSRIKSISDGLTQADFDSSLKNPEFRINVQVENKNEITISATDIYNNTDSITLNLNRVKNEKIIFKNSLPIIADNGNTHEILPDSSNSTTFYFKGKIYNVESFHNFIFNINNKPIKYELTDDEGLKYSDTLFIPLSQDSVNFTYVSNDNEIISTVYYINRKEVQSSEKSPMGRTWVVFIVNHDYTYWPSLDGPENDYAKVSEALKNYNIQQIIKKENLTSSSLNEYFKNELNSLVKTQKVKSLVIWYAGHGEYVPEEDEPNNGESYWIPVDARKNTPQQYFAISDLISQVHKYKTIKHLLIVSDACKTGASFVEKDRGNNSTLNCDDGESYYKNSFQALTSSGKENTKDNSTLAETFADVLIQSSRYNERCVSINAISNKVTERSSSKNIPKPELSNLSSFHSDPKATFLFIRK